MDLSNLQILKKNTPEDTQIGVFNSIFYKTLKNRIKRTHNLVNINYLVIN
jgi:hypothetical protein